MSQLTTVWKTRNVGRLQNIAIDANRKNAGFFLRES